MSTKKAIVVNNYYIKKDDVICLELYNEAWGRFAVPYYTWSQNYSNSSDLHPAKMVIGTKVLVRASNSNATGVCEYDITKRLTPVSTSPKKLEHDLDVPYMTVNQCYKYADRLLRKIKRISKQRTK
jgi:hypothetical protein